jgi:hypothetical protein
VISGGGWNGAEEASIGAFVQSAHNDLIMHNLCPSWISMHGGIT